MRLAKHMSTLFNRGNPAPPPTDHDLELLAGATLEVTSIASELIASGVNRSDGSGSPAETNMWSERNLATGGPASLVYDAHVVMLVTSTSAVDHVEFYVEGARHQLATVALASVVRSALENMSRASYLLRADSFDELVTRLVTLSHHDVIHPARVRTKFQDATGGIVDPEAYPQRLTTALTELGLMAPKMPSAENLVKMLMRPMLKTEAADEALREVYSQLSGIAHGNVTSLGMYRRPDGGFGYPLELAIQHSAYLYTSACSVGDAAVQYFGSERRERERWNAARDRATAAMIELSGRSNI